MIGQQEDQKRSPPSKLPPALEAAPRLEPPAPIEPEIAPSRNTVFDEVHSDFASFHEGYIRHYIALADTKAGVIFALAAGIIGYLLNDNNIQVLIIAPSYSIEFVLLTLTLVFLGLVAASAFFVIAPRFSAPSNEGLIFFGAVARRATADDFIQDIAGSTANGLTQARLKHCYDLARVCSRKYKILKLAIWLIPLSLLSAFLLLLTKS